MPVAEKYRNHLLFGAIGRAVNAIWLNRFEADYPALREILARMQKGGLLVIAPEGRAQKPKPCRKGKWGSLFWQARVGIPFCLLL